MVAIETAIAIALGGYVVGDTLHPVRHSVTAALRSMQTAIETDVENGNNGSN